MLTPEERNFIKTLRNADILQDVDDHRVDQRNGVILVACPDGDRYYDFFQHQVRMQAGQRIDPRIHPLAWHGGAIACAPNSPVNKIQNAHDVFLGQILDARRLKGIDLLGLCAHAPCAAACACDLTIEQSLALQIQAKKKIKSLSPGIQIVCFFHVDYGKMKRTYFLSRPKWEEWVESHRVLLLA